jgi:hypothetical protein
MLRKNRKLKCSSSNRNYIVWVCKKKNYIKKEAYRFTIDMSHLI